MLLFYGFGEFLHKITYTQVVLTKTDVQIYCCYVTYAKVILLQ